MTMIKSDKSLLRLSTAAMLAGLLVLAGCGGSGPQPEPPVDPGPDPAIAERVVINDAIDDAQTAVDAVNDESSDAVVTAADTAIEAARKAIADAANVPAPEKAANNGTVDTLESQLNSAKTSRKTAMAEADKQARDNARKMAMNLHTVIGTAIASTETNRFAKPANFADSDLSERKTLSVMGEKWSVQYATAPDLTAADDNGHIKASAFDDLEVGTQTHDGNQTGSDLFKTSGSYHGVAGTYTCDPTTENSCSSAIDPSGDLILAGGTWTFEPNNEDDRVMDSDGVEWGWWVNKDDDGNAATAGVFSGLTTGTQTLDVSGFGGKATYKGDAVGKYAVYRGAGAENDSGHFEADAELNADFTNDTLGGTIDGFTGSDGESRDWSVTLNSMTLGTTGGVTATTDVATSGQTVWTIGDIKGASGGEWTAQMYDQASATVAPSTAAGTFEAQHGVFGQMIGAFGAEKE